MLMFFVYYQQFVYAKTIYATITRGFFLAIHESSVRTVCGQLIACTLITTRSKWYLTKCSKQI